MSYACKDCNERQIGCHSSCETYLAEKEKRDAMNQALKKEKRIQLDVMATLLGENQKKLRRR